MCMLKARSEFTKVQGPVLLKVVNPNVDVNINGDVTNFAFY